MTQGTLPQATDQPELKIIRGAAAVELQGPPAALRIVLFTIADVVYPGWFEDPNGKELYTGYADGLADGKAIFHRKGFFDRGWERARYHLQLEGVKVTELN